MSELTLDSRLTRFAMLCLAVLVAVLVVATPAQASPGGSSAQAATTDIELTPEDTGIPQSIITALGSVSSPPDATVSIPSATVQADLGPTLGGVQDVLFFDDLAAESSSAATLSAGSASVGRMEVGTPGGALVITNVSSSVRCGLEGAPTASTGGPSEVTLDGTPVPLDGSGTGMIVQINEDLTGLLTAYGTITLAQSHCQSLALASTGESSPPILPIGVGIAVVGLGLYALGRRPARQ